MSAYPYVWVWRASRFRALDRHGKRCRVVCRGSMNSALIEFEDGFRSVISRNGLRKAPQGRALRPFAQQLDLDGQLHDIAPHSERLRLFDPVPAQLEGQTYLDLD